MKKKTSNLLFLLNNHTLFKAVLRKLFFYKTKRNDLSNSLEQNNEARWIMNYKYDCASPRTFNEFIGWLKYNYTNELWRRCADKLQEKDFIKEIGFGNYLPKVYKVYKNIKEIDLTYLPNEFVLKTNNDSGSVFICNKGTTNFNEIFNKLDEAMKTNYGKAEWVYDKIEPRIFAEELIKGEQQGDLRDYKFFIYNGTYKWGYVAQNRLRDCRFTVFDGDFKIQPVNYIYLRPRQTLLPTKPNHFKQMIDIAENIGKYFDFVRVDFYDTSDKPIIGELTFFPHSGLGSFTNNKFDFKYGEYFKDTIFFDLVKQHEKNN